MIDYFIQVGDYKEGRLAESAKQAFEAELSTNEELRQAVENHGIMDAALDMLWEDDARQVAVEARETVVKIELGAAETDLNIGAKVITMRRLLTAAAAVAALLVASLFLFQESSISKNDFLVSHQIELGLQTDTRGNYGNNETNRLWYAHMQLTDGQYSQAIPTLKELVKTSKSVSKDKAQYLLAYAFFAKDNRKEFEETIQEIVITPDHAFREKAEDFARGAKEYYLSLE